jgi:coenzyme F420-reducing hydrogenase alpha subunit
MADRKTIEINVPVLARVEGEGALELKITGDKVEQLRLRIFEPPRLFEQFLVGRSYSEVLDVVARICGICPVAYQMSASQALEQAFGMDAMPWATDMRRVFYCGEWIQSHSLHIHMLAAPDFHGHSSVVGLAGEYPDEVRRGLRLQEAGNSIIRLFGGRSVHPVGARVGGFWKAPAQKQVDELLAELNDRLDDAQQLLMWVSDFHYPQDEQEFVSVALRHPDRYAIGEGRIISSLGLDIPCSQYRDHFDEYQVPHSTALHSMLDGKPYLVGPLARLNLNHEQLPARVREVLSATGIRFPSRNMFHSIIARSAEIYFAITEAIRILEGYEETDTSYLDVKPVAGTGFGCTEAPRGILWHRYELDGNGDVVSAEIVPPTSQNQARIEQDLVSSIENFGANRTQDEIRQHCETIIRNYDPCISCATHFLSVDIERK